MAKINLVNNTVKEKNVQNERGQGKGDRVLSLISNGTQYIQALADIFDTVNSTIDRKKTTDTENMIKLIKAENDVRKEENRHKEEMARIEYEWKKLSDTAEDREKKRSIIKDKIERFQLEYDKYLDLETKEFLSDTITPRLDSLRKVILELTKELNRA